MKTAEQSIRKLKPVIRGWVEETLYEILGAPDEGLELKEHIKARLKKAFASRRRNGRTAKEVAQRLGLRW